MKLIVLYAMAGAVVLGTGCTKENENGTTEPMTTEEMVGKVEEVTVKAEAVTREVSGKAEEAVTALTVKAEDVMDDLNRSVAQVKEKTAALDKTHLMAYAGTYKDVLMEKKEQLTVLTEKVKGLSPMELIGDQGKALKSELAKYTEQLDGLKERYNVYLEKLGNLGVDLSAYTL